MNSQRLKQKAQDLPGSESFSLSIYDSFMFRFFYGTPERMDKWVSDYFAFSWGSFPSFDFLCLTSMWLFLSNLVILNVINYLVFYNLIMSILWKRILLCSICTVVLDWIKRRHKISIYPEGLELIAYTSYSYCKTSVRKIHVLILMLVFANVYMFIFGSWITV